MEEVFIPDISTVLRTSKECIDRPATLSEVLRIQCKPDNIRSTMSTTGLLGDILDKLVRHMSTKITQTDVPATTMDLCSIVKELTLTILSDTNTKETTVAPSLLRYFKTTKCLRTIDTIGDSLRKQLTEKAKELDKHIKKHQNLTEKIQKAQKKCWISNSKASKYRLMLTTAESSRKYLDGQLTKRDAKSRDKAIVDLKQTLKQKQERADDDAMTFCKLLSEEEMARQNMKKIKILNDDIREEIKFELMDRLETCLCDLNDLANTILGTDSRTVIQGRLMELDVRKVANAVLSNGQKVYTYANPTEFTKSHGYAEKIPVGKILKKCDHRSDTEGNKMLLH